MVAESGFFRFGALAWAALVLTTLANTLLPQSGPYLGLTSEQLDFWRDVVLVPHGMLGLVASWVVTLALLRAAPLSGTAGLTAPSCVFGVRNLRGTAKRRTRCQTWFRS